MIPANEKATIMLVDDTPANLRLLEQLLKNEAYRVMQFPNGRTALGALAKKQPDLILLDIMMPEMDGFEVCARLKENVTTRDIPVIFISALADTEHKIRAFTEGGVDYVTKPFQEEEILARVKTHLSLRQMQQELRKHNLYLEDLVREKVREISESQLSTIHAVSKLAEYRDDETGRHIERTRLFCRMLAEVLAEKSRYSGNIKKNFIENIYHAAPLHDIGKVGIPDNILLKPGKLDTEEFELIKTHTIIGATTLQQVRNKYPQNGFVNMSARIMAVADVYDALRSERPYKKAFSHEKSCGIIREGNGSHFDPDIVAAFNSIHLEMAQVREQIKGHDIMPPSDGKGCRQDPEDPQKVYPHRTSK
jgi:putative two-component system response regulator